MLLSEIRGRRRSSSRSSSAARPTPTASEVRGEFSGLWLAGSPHVFFFPSEPARLAGNTLVWQGIGTTYRLEGPGLTKQDALDLAASLARYPVDGGEPTAGVFPK